jgi:hypothetical protein
MGIHPKIKLTLNNTIYTLSLGTKALVVQNKQQNMCSLEISMPLVVLRTYPTLSLAQFSTTPKKKTHVTDP